MSAPAVAPVGLSLDMPMLYFANPVRVAEPAMVRGQLGFIDTPAQGNRRRPGVMWCADNGVYGAGYPGDRPWFRWLARRAKDEPHLCAFATAPDVVADAPATLVRSLPWLEKIRSLGLRAALVGQDGLEHLPVPWDDFDAFFIGGSTEWKLSRAAYLLAEEASERGKWVHMGRVNSRKRVRIARNFGCNSVDGTYLVYGPTVNLPKLLGWMAEPTLF